MSLKKDVTIQEGNNMSEDESNGFGEITASYGFDIDTDSLNSNVIDILYGSGNIINYSMTEKFETKPFSSIVDHHFTLIIAIVSLWIILIVNWINPDQIMRENINSNNSDLNEDDNLSDNLLCYKFYKSSRRMKRSGCIFFNHKYSDILTSYKYKRNANDDLKETENGLIK
ncbi:hypothetical protein K502DRAFT_349787 [Neoconidiobolus thromboides FSU 785]|nr:hypothetical protein K502DRAFT_349787 [Neoconidiobolus thromboides FSU 785]